MMREAGSPLYRFSRSLLRTLFRLFNRWEVSGQEHVPESGGLLLIANHTSYADPPIVGAACPRPVNFMAKAELFQIPLLAGFIRRTHAFPVQRGSGDRAALRRAVRLLRDGKVVLIFPEGARSSDGRLKGLEIGAAFIALSGQAQVVPIAIVGADRLLPRGKPILLPAKLRVRFGPALDLSRFRGRRPTRQVLQQVADVMRAAFRQVLPAERL
jgi:1-acyl-sn-glycerol-3-phosphate acyltransferase